MAAALCFSHAPPPSLRPGILFVRGISRTTFGAVRGGGAELARYNLSDVTATAPAQIDNNEMIQWFNFQTASCTGAHVLKQRLERSSSYFTVKR